MHLKSSETVSVRFRIALEKRCRPVLRVLRHRLRRLPLPPLLPGEEALAVRHRILPARVGRKAAKVGVVPAAARPAIMPAAVLASQLPLPGCRKVVADPVTRRVLQSSAPLPLHILTLTTTGSLAAPAGTGIRTTLTGVVPGIYLPLEILEGLLPLPTEGLPLLRATPLPHPMLQVATLHPPLPLGEERAAAVAVGRALAVGPGALALFPTGVKTRAPAGPVAVQVPIIHEVEKAVLPSCTKGPLAHRDFPGSALPPEEEAEA